MIRLFLIAYVYALVLAAHLRKDRRKGSHPQKSHGSWSPNNSFTSKRAASRAKSSDNGRKAAQGRKLAVNSGSGDNSKVPRTRDEAIDAVIQAFIDSGDERVKNDSKLRDKIKKNYKGIFKDTIDNANSEKRADLDSARERNRSNPRYSKATDKFGEPAVIFKKYDEEEDLNGAAAYQKGPITVVLEPHRSYMNWDPGPGKTELGGATVDSSLSGTLRHEFGHHVEHQLESGRIGEFRAALPSGDTLNKDLSYYAGTSWDNGNHSEPFAELVSVVTAPTYNHADLPNSIKPAAKLIEGYLYGA